MAKILVVENVKQYAEMLEQALKLETHQVSVAYSEEEAQKKLRDENFDLVTLDIALEGDKVDDVSGLKILEIIQKKCYPTQVIVISGYAQHRLEALRKGTFYFIEKGNDTREELLLIINNALTFRALCKQKIDKDNREAIGLDDKGYLTVTSEKIIEQFKSIEFLGINVNKFESFSEIMKFRTLTEKVSDKYIKNLEYSSNADMDIRNMLDLLINNSCQMDILLYLTQKRYRDHYKHQFLVGALGCFLLDIILTSGETLRRHIARQINLSEDEIDQAWWTSALLHDHGYPLSYILKSVLEINNFQKELAGGQGVIEIIEKMKALYASYRNIFSAELLNVITEKEGIDVTKFQTLLQNLINCFANPSGLTGLVRKIEGLYLFDHGLIGAANIVSFLQERLGGQLDKIINFITQNRWIRESLSAIALHNSPYLCEEVTFNKHPIAFLLKLCDELQEWDRKTFYKEDIKGELLVETDHIKLGCLSYAADTGKYSFINVDKKACLSVIFEYRDPVRLEKTGWNFSLFEESKKRNLSSLNVTDSFIGSFSFEVAKLNRISKR